MLNRRVSYGDIPPTHREAPHTFSHQPDEVINRVGVEEVINLLLSLTLFLPCRRSDTPGPRLLCTCHSIHELAFDDDI
jgi:hypothetical protein